MDVHQNPVAAPLADNVGKAREFIKAQGQDPDDPGLLLFLHPAWQQALPGIEKIGGFKIVFEDPGKRGGLPWYAPAIQRVLDGDEWKYGLPARNVN